MRYTIIKYLFFVFFVFISFRYELYGQSDTLGFTPFSKGRSLVALTGSISSAINNRPVLSSGSDKVLNNYNFDVRLAKLLARNYALGIVFSTEKYSSQQLVLIDTEVLAIGPWSSYYFTNGQSGGLFIQGGIYFISYYERNQFRAISPPVDELVVGKGFAGQIGFGYTYVIFNRVGLEVSMDFRQGRIYSETKNYISKSSNYEAFNRVDIAFNFGFIVLFNKIKND